VGSHCASPRPRDHRRGLAAPVVDRAAAVPDLLVAEVAQISVRRRDRGPLRRLRGSVRGVAIPKVDGGAHRPLRIEHGERLQRRRPVRAPGADAADAAVVGAGQAPEPAGGEGLLGGGCGAGAGGVWISRGVGGEVGGGVGVRFRASRAQRVCGFY